MRRLLFILVAAGSLTAAAATISSADPVQSSTGTQLTGGSVIKVNSTQLSQIGIADAATTVSPKKALTHTEEDSNLSTYVTLLITLLVMATIAFRRTRARRP